MKPENRPEVEFKFVVVKLTGDRGRMASIRTVTEYGTDMTLNRWQWPASRPEPAILDEIGAVVAQELVATLVARYGVQGVLPGT